MKALLAACTREPPPDNPAAYFTAVARNQILRMAQDARRTVPCHQLDEIADIVAPCSASEPPAFRQIKLARLWDEVFCKLDPDKAEIFQVLPIAGQNDGLGSLLVSPSEFRGYVERHARLAEEGIAIVPEDNAAMTGSYIMIDAMGRFFDNIEGRLVYGPPILDVGVERAFASVRWERERMVARGGIYPWRRRWWPEAASIRGGGARSLRDRHSRAGRSSAANWPALTFRAAATGAKHQAGVRALGRGGSLGLLFQRC